MKKIILDKFNKFLYIFRSSSEMMLLVWHSQPIYFLGLIFVEVAQGILPVASAWIIKQTFDLLAQAFQYNSRIILWNELIPLLFGQTIVSVVIQIMPLASSYLSSELSRKLSLNVQSKIFSKINSLAGLAPFEDTNFYNTIQLATQGANSGPLETLNAITNFTQNIIIFLSFIGILLAFDPFLAFLVGLTAIPQIYIQLRFGQQRFNLAMFNSPKERLVSYYSYVLSNSKFAKELRLFDLADYFLQNFQQLSKKINNTKRKQQLYEFRWQVALNLISSIIASGAFIFVILRSIDGDMTIGSVIFYISAVSSIQAAFLGIIFSFSSLNESSLFYSQYKKLLSIPQPLPIQNSPVSLTSLVSNIELRNISFRYEHNGKWVLRKFNLNIPAGKCVALVGLNGAGKTTLVKLISRLYDPTEGEILWNGVDIRKFDPKDLRKRMTVIFQDFVHYDLSVYENIALGNLNRFNDFKLVQKSAKKAGIDDVIQELSQGYQTILSHWLAAENNGIDLSGGEWQKIAMARMLMRNTDLLILDEPTSALDAQSEYNAYKLFLKLIKGKTSILISHRFSTIRMADKIAVLSDGEIIEFGSHNELMKLGGKYSYMYNLQAKSYNEI